MKLSVVQLSQLETFGKQISKMYDDHEHITDNQETLDRLDLGKIATALELIKKRHAT